MSRILMLDLLLKQMKDKHTMAADVVKRVNAELEVLVSTHVLNSVQSYLIMHNGKKMKGMENIWKYRLTDGDRILYTYGRFLPYIREAENNTLVLLGYAKHDDQGFFGKYHHFEQERNYVDVANYIRSLHEITDKDSVQEITSEDLYTIAELMSPQYLREHAAYVVSTEMIANATTEELDENPVLSEEQSDCIDEFFIDPKPTIILGGAGTGKTLIAVHILNNYTASDERGEKAAYFTQSEELRRNVEHRYRIISEADEIAAMFYNINDYCMDILGISDKKKQLMTYSKFAKEVFERLPKALVGQCMKNGIDSLCAWTEIRGIIKGQLDHNWRRCSDISQREIPGVTDVSRLVKMGIIHRSKKDPTRVYIDNIEKAIPFEKEHTLSKQDNIALNFMIKYFSSVDTNMVDIGEDAYYSLSSENSTLNQDQRRILWKVYSEYDNYLNKNHMFDDNDLARKVIAEVQANSREERFGLTIVDEVQDYTELQIFLMHTLSKDGKQIVYAGDANQNVNPTLFQESKLQRLYQGTKDGTELNTIFLTSNYRCPKETVKVTNILSEMRREIIARGKIEREQEETSGRTGTVQFRLRYSQKNVRDLLLEMMKYPRTAFLVADEMSKQEMIQIIGEDLYKKNGVPFIHTVSEIKGMEYSYVVCFDLFGKYMNIWNDMLAKDHRKKRTGERYYFNLPYVAMTRTQQHLCVIDKKENTSLNERLQLPFIQVFEAKKLYFDLVEKGTDAWIRAARESEENGHYQDAFELYKKAGASYRDIRRCEAKVCAENGDYTAAACNAIIAGDRVNVISFSKQLDSDNPVKKLVYAMTYLNSDVHETVYNLVEEIFAKANNAYSAEEITEARLFCIEQLDDLLNRYLDQFEDWINDVDDILGEVS